MGEIFLIVKASVLTLVIVMVLQIRIGNNTIEERIHAWAKGSTVVEDLQKVAKGAVVVGKKAFYQATASLEDTKVGDAIRDVKEIPGERHKALIIERSKGFVEEQKRRLDEAAAIADADSVDEEE